MARKSRPQQWAEACDEARTALDALEAAHTAVLDCFAVLADLQGEYQDWMDNMPDSLQSSPTYDKLSEVTGLDLEPDESSSPQDLADLLDNAEGVDLPRGFGND
jgi:hypothetical protein